MSDAKNYILPNRIARIKFGFGTEYFQNFIGRGQTPKVDIRKKITDFHFYDELQKISEFKLSGGQLETDVRTDRYIWGILDEVYEDFFTVIASCDTAESWAGDATDDTDNQRFGDACQKLTSDTTLQEGHLTLSSLDLSDYDHNDFIYLYLYVENKSDTDAVNLKLTDGGANVALYDLMHSLNTGWNALRLRRSDFYISADLYGNRDFNSETTDAEPSNIVKIGSTNTYTVKDKDQSQVPDMEREKCLLIQGANVHNWLKWSNITPSTGDYEITMQFRFNNWEGERVGIIFRGDGSDSNAYALLVRNGNTIRFARMVGTSETVLNTVSIPQLTTDVTYMLKVQAIGSALKGKMWIKSEGEPTTWNIEITNTTYANTRVLTGVYAYSSVNTNIFIDDFRVYKITPVFDWSDVDEVRIEFDSDTNGRYILFDSIRIGDDINYPYRDFDVGLQTIPVAWWGGNTALFEIKTACEAEGARFYADEYGNLRFENRQHYNANDEHKVSVWSFNFDNILDMEYMGLKDSEIINTVVVKLKPRIIEATQSIWDYSFVREILASETITIWAEFQNPVPTTTTGLITPVATTDYTANTQSDGGGTDKTAQIGITITKFASGAKLEITNNDAGTVYLTSLGLRGTPAIEGDEIQVRSEDTDSILDYGVQPKGGYIIDNKYLADESYAQTLADNIRDWYKSGEGRRIVLKNRAVPQLQMGDMITVRNDETGASYLMRIVRIKLIFDKNGFNQDIYTRAVSGFELLNYFTIGTSEIEGTDVISP